MAFGFNPFGRFGSLNQLASPSGFNANPYASLLYGNAYGTPGSGGGGYGGSGGGYGGGGSGGGGSGGGGYGADSSYDTSSYAPDQQARSDQHAEYSNHRKVYDEYLYTGDKSAAAEQERQKAQREQLQRSLSNPTATEIRSGQALNAILADLGPVAAAGDLTNTDIFPLPLDEEGQKHIHVTPSVAPIDLLKNDGQLNCPVALSAREYKAARERLADQAVRAARQVGQSGRVQAATLWQMQSQVDYLYQQLSKEGKKLPASEYIAAKRFLNQFDAAIQALRQPDTGGQVSAKYVLKAKTVPELVKQMTEQGLEFAQAMPEDEAAYTALHYALAAYYRAVRAQSLAK
jgi:hypothetical protein